MQFQVNIILFSKIRFFPIKTEIFLHVHSTKIFTVSTFFFRLAQEGALMTIPFLGSRVIYPTKKDIQTLLLSSDIDHPPSLSEMEPQTFDQLNALETGSVAFVYQDNKGNF